MNTIHSIFNRVNTSYTVIGNNQQKIKIENNSISALLLSRGGRPYREELYKELLKFNICEIISVQLGSKSYFDLENETVLNSNLRFLILKDDVSPGEMINIGISECQTEFVFVLWDDMYINSKNISYRVFEKIAEENRICTTPFMVDNNNELIPTLMTPLFNKELLKVIPLKENRSLKTLFPYMYVGIYNKDKFVRLGGFDIDIINTYWQKIDFGLRAHMWGEEILSHKSFIITSGMGEVGMEDITPDNDYRLYCLKNLSVIIKKDVGYLPLRRFFSYYDKSGSSLLDALKTFLDVRKWVNVNKFRFKESAPTLTSNWEHE